MDVSLGITFILLLFYFALMGTTFLEGNYAMSLYWFGALILNIAVLKMGYS